MEARRNQSPLDTLRTLFGHSPAPSLEVPHAEVAIGDAAIPHLLGGGSVLAILLVRALLPPLLPPMQEHTEPGQVADWTWY